MKCKEDKQEVTERCGKAEWKLKRTTVAINRRQQSRNLNSRRERLEPG